MVEKVYVTQNETGTFICPNCQKSKTVGVSKFIKSNKNINIKVSCPCGHTFTSFLERRKNYRKKTNLTGTFVRLVDGKPTDRGRMIVRDLSLTGVGLKFLLNYNFEIGDILEIDFDLDNPHETRLKRKVIIRNIKDSYVGTEFYKREMEDKILGFYLRR